MRPLIGQQPCWHLRALKHSCHEIILEHDAEDFLKSVSGKEIASSVFMNRIRPPTYYPNKLKISATKTEDPLNWNQEAMYPKLRKEGQPEL